MQLSPTPGLEESITVIISFHYVFVTKVDKAYRVVCSYGQDSQDNVAIVTQNLNIR